MAKRLSISEFIKRANKKFNWKFDYNKVKFIHSKEPVSIICPEHGEFFQIPYLHLKSKFGCPHCIVIGKKTTEDFIKDAKKIYGTKYSYAKSIYNGYKEKLIITCPIHGDFVKTPVAHIRGKKECPKCTGKININKETFINKAINVHGDKYIYDNVIYIDTHTKIELFCNVKEHGSFLVSPANHLHKSSPQGCPVCGRQKSAQSLSMTTEEFIAKARNKYNNKYTYNNTVYTRSNKKVKINCPEHGEFEQQANSHLQGSGCPECGKFKNHTATRKTTKEFITEARKIHGGNMIIQTCSIGIFIPKYVLYATLTVMANSCKSQIVI